MQSLCDTVYLFLVQLNFQILQEAYCGKLADFIPAFFPNARVKELLNLVYICQSYQRKIVWVFFDSLCRTFIQLFVTLSRMFFNQV